jgi:5'-3' exonuclease
MISVDKIEADDVIGYLASTKLKNEVYIMSADRDFLQLVNDRVTVYNPVKKIYYRSNYVK